MKIDWYDIKSEMKRSVWANLEKAMSRVDAEIEKLERIGMEKKPEPLEERDLKKLKKAELIKMLIESDEQLCLEIMGTGIMAQETTEEVVDEIRDMVLNLEDEVLKALKRSFRHMEENEQT